MIVKPTDRKLSNAADTCEALADYLQDTQPRATMEISRLREAGEYLSAHVGDE